MTDTEKEQINGQTGGSARGAQPVKESTKRELIAAVNQNWQREMEGMRNYRGLAGGEKEKGRHNVLLKLAEAEERHAQKWERKLIELGAPVPQERRSPGSRLRSWVRRQ